MKDDAEFTIATAPRRNSVRWKQGKTTWAQLRKMLEVPADEKECGNYVLGLLDGPRRNARSIVSRSALTLDADAASDTFLADVREAFEGALLAHSTYKSKPGARRYRLIIPFDRDVSPEEYFAIANIMMDRLGRNAFDIGSVEPSRYMFRPSSAILGYYEKMAQDGEPLAVDEVLADWNPDLSRLPMPGTSQKRDPFEMAGVVGAFNRVYEDFDALIEAYDLPYEPAGDRRWHLIGADSQGGLGQVDNGLVYSHHVKDPAWGQACSAFDLVRLHRFSELDEDSPDATPINRLPSHQAMIDLASSDAEVTREMIGTTFGKVTDGDAPIADDDWRFNITMNGRTGRMDDTIQNWELIAKHDPTFAVLTYNEMTMTIEADGDFPWREITPGRENVTGADRASIAHHLEREYGIRAARAFIDELINTAAVRRSRHPVREYLEGLVWDGVPRLEESLPGVRPTPYSRMVARKALVAAVARVLDPGCKWDHTMVLQGVEGLGKSWWIERMARGFSASLGNIRDKDTLLAMHRSWIVVADEGHSLRKADADLLKEFLTRTFDVFRMPYDREAQKHDRNMVIWSTINDEVFLRRQEGNRRFLVVKATEEVDFSAITDDYIDQVWAEAVALYMLGEPLYLNTEERALAAAEREAYTEEDTLAGILEEYLNRLVPEDWEEMTSDQRVTWMMSRDSGMVPPGTRRQSTTCTMALWVEALGRVQGEHRRADMLDLSTALRGVPGWKNTGVARRISSYGPQKVWVRDEDDIL